MGNNCKNLLDADTQDYNIETSTTNAPETVESPRNVRARVGNNVLFVPKATTNPSHRIPSSYKMVTDKEMMEEDAISMRKVMYL